MSDLHQRSSLTSRFNAFWTSLKRWGFFRAEGDATMPVVSSGPGSIAEGRWPGATRPVYLEVSPASAEPFPEPRTIPHGWDMSELVKTR